MSKNNGKARGEFRCLSPAEIGGAVRTFRQQVGWKQLTLAYEAGVHERTVQRVERGQKVDDETLRGIAKALHLPEQAFVGPRYIPSPDELSAHVKSLLEERTVIKARIVSNERDCQSILSHDHGFLCDDRKAPSGMAEQIARFKDFLRDWVDIYNDLSFSDRAGACRSLFEEIRNLEEQGCEIRYGIYTTDDSFDISVLLFMAKGDECLSQITQIVVPRKFTAMV